MFQSVKKSPISKIEIPQRIYTTYSKTNLYKEARSLHCTSLSPLQLSPKLQLPNWRLKKPSPKPPIDPYIISRAYLMLLIYCDIAMAPSCNTFQPKNFPLDCQWGSDCTGQRFPRPIQCQAQLVPRPRTLKRKGWRCKRQTVSGLLWCASPGTMNLQYAKQLGDER